jgi:hypothetical protein
MPAEMDRLPMNLPMGTASCSLFFLALTRDIFNHFNTHL